MNDSPEHERWLDADTAERLLIGEDIAEPDHRIAALARLLAAADGTEAGKPEHEHAALRAFARAQAVAPGRAARRTLRESRTAKVLVGGAAAVFAFGGVAIAAQTGALPHPFHSGPAAPVTGNATTATGTPGAPQSVPATTGATTHPAPHSPPLASHPGHATGAPGVPGPKGLCESYLKAVQGDRRLDSPSLSRLEEAAGGAAEIDAYCAALTGQPDGHTPSPAPHPTHPTHPATPSTSRRK